MKFRFNPLYLILLIVLIFIFQFNWKYKNKTYTFYGFAQNKETEINYEESVLINQTFVTEGQYVKEGDTLLIAKRHQEFDEVEINDAQYDREAIRRNEAAKKIEIQSAIRRLEAQRLNKVSEIESDIRTLQAELDLNQAILSEIKSVDVSSMTVENSPKAAKIKVLRKEKELITGPIDVEIEKLRAELKAPTAAQIKMNKLSREAIIHQKEYDKIIITAPSDGLIGNMHFKLGENAKSFSTLISFYERNPTLVIGYVHENLIVHVNEGDSIEVISSYYSENKLKAEVIGLGTRIVEIPSRLRKIPEFKTYGREVMIQLPPQNDFLQKEKVILNLLNTDAIPTNISLEPQRNSNNLEKDINKLLEK